MIDKFMQLMMKVSPADQMLALFAVLVMVELWWVLR